MEKLRAEVKSSELLFHLIHEAGSTFFVVKNQKGKVYEVEVVYFSGKKFIHFSGVITEEELNRLKGIGWEVSKIEVDEQNNEVKILE